MIYSNLVIVYYSRTSNFVLSTFKGAHIQTDSNKPSKNPKITQIETLLDVFW